MRKPKAPAPTGRTIATTTLLDGEIRIGATITISTIMDEHPRRTIYRGLVCDIRTFSEGDFAHIAVLGRSELIAIRLEPLPSPEAGT